MNLDHLGDAYDFWKRAMLNVVRKPGAALKIMPMVTGKTWREQEFSTYETVLGARTDELVSTKFDRKKGFPPRCSTGARKWQEYDLFLDPDTGIENNKDKEPSNKSPGPSNKRLGSGNNSPKSLKYLKHSELEKLLGKTNVVAVYQHAPREGNGWLKTKLANLQEDADLGKHHIKAVGYEAGRVGMIFVTKNGARSKEIEKELKKLAGPTAKERVFSSKGKTR